MIVKKYLAALLTVAFLASAQLSQAADLPDFSELAAKSGPAVVNICLLYTSPSPRDS